MAADAEPLEILLHLPLLCEDKVGKILLQTMYILISVPLLCKYKDGHNIATLLLFVCLRQQFFNHFGMASWV